MGARAVIAMAMWAGCYGPHPQGGTCETTAQCPEPLQCVAGVCGGAAGDGGLDAHLADADPSCACGTGEMLTCASGTVSCALGCVASAPAHCARLAPSNGVDVELVGNVSDPITITGAITIDTDTGEITGVLVRPATTGTAAGIDYEHMPGMGVFVFDALTITSTATVGFTGTRSAVFLVAQNATIGGPLVLGGGRDGPGSAGPGGGGGALDGATAGGCAAGGAGQTDLVNKGDGGGGGGGGGSAGAPGGTAGTFLGGTAGASCIATDVQPLVGGSGGGGGGPGATTGASGGGGGGALQLSVLGVLTFKDMGSIDASGGGGEGGPPGGAAADAGAGAGGGAGGAILLEALEIHTGLITLFAANGGGGGGGGLGATAGSPGENGKLGTNPAPGGGPAGGNATEGGAGGAGMAPAAPGIDTDVTGNGGGGGGGAGRMRFNTLAGSSQLVLASPQPTWGAIKLR